MPREVMSSCSWLHMLRRSLCTTSLNHMQWRLKHICYNDNNENSVYIVNSTSTPIMSHRAATWIAFGAICRRSFTTLTAARDSPRHQLSGYRLPGHSYLASQATRSRSLPKNHFTANRALRQDAASESPKRKSERKTTRNIYILTACGSRGAAIKRRSSQRQRAEEARRPCSRDKRSHGLLRRRNIPSLSGPTPAYTRGLPSRSPQD
jgi:hypothetical protein